MNTAKIKQYFSYKKRSQTVCKNIKFKNLSSTTTTNGENAQHWKLSG